MSESHVTPAAQAGGPVSVPSRPTGEWSPGGLEDLAGLIGVRVGAWNHFGYAHPPTPDCATIPPLGERSGDAIKAGHQAVREIDQLIRDLHALRGQLVSELRANADAVNARVDATLAARRGGDR